MHLLENLEVADGLFKERKFLPETFLQKSSKFCGRFKSVNQYSERLHQVYLPDGGKGNVHSVQNHNSKREFLSNSVFGLSSGKYFTTGFG